MRAKMQVQSVTKVLGGWADVIKFSAVYGGSTNDEDNSFAKTTPSATLEMNIANKELMGVYQPGDTFYVDFTPVPKA